MTNWSGLRWKRRRGTRQISVTIHIDFIHVLGYVWAAVWCCFIAGDPKAEAWGLEQGLAILEGRAATVAAAMRRKATVHELSAEQRKAVDRCADYLLRKNATWTTRRP